MNYMKRLAAEKRLFAKEEPLMYEYKVVRTLDFPASTKMEKEELENAFFDGYEFVSMSNHIGGKGGYCGYIEYILRRKIKIAPVKKKTLDNPSFSKKTFKNINLNERFK